jgi:tetratricopeptide (TPR) repeat protein
VTGFVKQQLLSWTLVMLSLSLCMAFFYWANYALYDPKQLENKGHHFFASKQYSQAYHYFYQAAEITTTLPDIEPQKLSSRFRFAATAAYKRKNYPQAVAMLVKSLHYNPVNQQATQLLKHMLHKKQISKIQLQTIDKKILTIVNQN